MLNIVSLTTAKLSAMQSKNNKFFDKLHLILLASIS
jgi:hypothetical protein